MAGVNLATAYYQLLPSMAGNQSAITAQMGAAGTASSQSFSSKFSSGLKGPIIAAGVAGAAAAAVGFVKGAIAEGREAQKVGALTAQVIKSTGGAANVTAKSVGNLSTAISKKTGIDDETIQSSANMLLTFTNVRNEVGKGNDVFNQATQTVTDMSAALGQDGKSSAIQLGKALNDPVKGITALTRVGVSFTAEQKKQIATMVKAGDTVGAQKVILGELSKEFGGAASAQATAGDKMSVAWKNLQEAVGTALIPILDKLQAGLAKVFNFISTHQSVMVAIGAVLGVVLVAALIAATAAVWSFTIALLANPLVWIVIAIIAVVAAVVLLIKNWDKIKAKTAEVWAAMKAAISKAWTGIKTAISTAVANVKAKIQAAWDAVKSKTAAAWDAVKTAVTTRATALVNFIKGLPAKIVAFFKALPGQLKTIGTNIVTGLRDGISAAWHFVTDKVQALIAKIPLAIQKLLGIASPSKVMMELGGHIAEGLAVGMDKGQGRVASSALSLAGSAVAPMSIQSSASGTRGSSSRPVVLQGAGVVAWLNEHVDGRAEIILAREGFLSAVGA